MLNENILPLNIETFLSKDKYRIPVYQRNYDWGEREALQLIEDIADYASLKKDKKYYIGSAVVFGRVNGSEEYFETIDGQQRLTTLTILASVLKQIDDIRDRMEWFKEVNISYDHREDADEAIRSLASNKLSDKPAAVSISEVYRIIQKNLLNKLNEKEVSLADFVEYFLTNVIIMRIPVPRDTDLNHYFEIMNSRGEQLEKHEVLKAILMDNLEEDKATFCLFNDIWEACSDMNTYVQMKMRPALRKKVFSDTWTDLQYDDFNTLVADYRHMNDDDDSNDEDEYTVRTLSQLFVDADNNVKYDLPDSDREVEGSNDRFGSIVNFPNFLLHTLKIMYHHEAKDEYKKIIDDEIKLDDKRLVDIFQMVLQSHGDRRNFVKRFAMAMLTMRVLFDSYVIKREYYNGKEGWSLKTPKLYSRSKVNYVGTFSGKDDNEDDVRVGLSVEVKLISRHVEDVVSVSVKALKSTNIGLMLSFTMYSNKGFVISR